MKNDSLLDFAAFSLLKVLGPLLRVLPRGFVFSCGRLLGELVYLFDLKHRAVVHANLRTAFAGKMSPAELRRATKDFFRSFGQNIIEVFLIPTIDEAYIRRYVRFEGLEHVHEAFLKGKGVLLCSVHAGSWELANILSANLGFPFSMFVRDQKLPRVEGLLNEYRRSKGCRLIQRKDQMRELIRVLRENEATGLTVDQGGRNGTRVDFFGKEASMSSGAVRLALKYGATLVPVFFSRVKGPFLRVTVAPPFRLKVTGDTEKDVTENLQELVKLFEAHISRYPHEYLWSYKVWKYSGERRILILSDGRTGHLRQSQALAKITAAVYAERGIRASVETVEVKYAGSAARSFASLLNVVSGRHICRGCLMCLRGTLEPGSYKGLTGAKYDVIISCGSELSAPNYILARENNCDSFVIMRPALAALDRFDLVVMPAHDRPSAARNVARTEGALNLIDAEYLERQAAQLSAEVNLRPGAQRIGFLVGGDTKDFRLDTAAIRGICRQLSETARARGAELLVTTSRRSPGQAEAAVREECPDAALRVIASEKNPPYAVGGILGVSSVVVCSPESISMISEAATSPAHVVVFRAEGLGRRHRAFLENLSRRGHILLVEPEAVGREVARLLDQRPARFPLTDAETVRAAVRKVLH